jgi:hypothetical protein
VALLYYAGMGADRATAQIGLAVSADGVAFERVNGSGLVLGPKPDVAWKALRVCNPTVVRFQGRRLMFYQGVGRGPAPGALTHAIGLARSSDGISWECDDQPFLTFDDVRRSCPAFAATETGGVIDPAVLVRGDQLVLFFVAYRGTYQQGTWLMRATSADGERWAIDPVWVLSGRQFGEYRLHYPHVTEEPWGLALWFSLIDQHTEASAIVKMASVGGAPWARLEQVLPQAGRPPQVRAREVLALRVRGRTLPGFVRLNRVLNRLLSGGRDYLGYAHSHVAPTPSGDRLYYHAYHQRPDGKIWMDIGSCPRGAEADAAAHVRTFSPAADGEAWDSFFVADPFVAE